MEKIYRSPTQVKMMTMMTTHWVDSMSRLLTYEDCLRPEILCHLVSKPILKKPTHVINACPEYFCFKCLYTILVCTFIPTKQIWSHKRLKWASPSPNKSNHSTRWSLKSLTCSTPKTGPISSGSNLALCSLKNNMMKTLNCKQAKYRSYFVILDMKTRLRWFTYS